MAKKTTGKLYVSGTKGYWYIRYKFEGKENRMRLLDTTGKPITKEKDAQAAANRLLARIHETNKAEQLRTLKNDLQDAEQAAADAAAQLLNSKATVAGGWKLFMGCPKRPASCKRFPIDAIPRHTTAANYRSYYERFVGWLGDKYPAARLISEVTPEIAVAFMDVIRQVGASGTFNKYLQFFNCFFDTLAGAGKITAVNPFQDIDRAAHQYNSKKPLTVEQIAALIDTATGDMRLLVALGYFSGLRMGDCCTLQWREVDLLRGVIERIPRKTAHTVKDKEQAVVKVGIPPYLFEMLSAIPKTERGTYLLPKFAEKYLAGGDQQITKWILKHFQSCGIEIHRPGTGIQTITDPETGETQKTGCRAVVEVGFHSLRYSYISHNAEAGTPAAVIQRNAGHANPAMTEHYTKISDAAAVKYAEVLQLPGGTLEAATSAEIIDVMPGQTSTDEPERAKFRQLADTLSLDQIRAILANIPEAGK